VTLVDVPEAKLAQKPENFFPEPIEIRLNDLPTGSDFTVFAAAYGDPEGGLPDERQVEALLRPYLARHRATATVGVDTDESDYGGMYQLGLEITMPARGRTVRDAVEVARGALALLEATEGGTLTRQRTLDLLRGGRADVLVGQPENDWLDFKREGYAKTEHGKV